MPAEWYRWFLFSLLFLDQYCQEFVNFITKVKQQQQQQSLALLNNNYLLAILSFTLFMFTFPSFCYFLFKLLLFC